MIYQQIVESEETLRFIFSGGHGSSSAKIAASKSTVKHMDNNAKDIISSLLRFSANLRLGMWRNGINDIWEHAFLKGIRIVPSHDGMFIIASFYIYMIC